MKILGSTRQRYRQQDLIMPEIGDNSRNLGQSPGRIQQGEGQRRNLQVEESPGFMVNRRSKGLLGD